MSQRSLFSGRRPWLIAMVAVLVVIPVAYVGLHRSTPSQNAADVMFVQMMTPHHLQAVELAKIALDPRSGADPVIIAMAKSIIESQSGEVRTFRELAHRWHVMLGHDGMMHDGMMVGLASDADISRLQSLRGQRFDALWASLMVAHHRGAIQMARDVLRGGINHQVHTIAKSIIRTQRAEIAQLTSGFAAS